MEAPSAPLCVASTSLRVTKPFEAMFNPSPPSLLLKVLRLMLTSFVPAVLSRLAPDPLLSLTSTRVSVIFPAVSITKAGAALVTSEISRSLRVKSLFQARIFTGWVISEGFDVSILPTQVAGGLTPHPFHPPFRVSLKLRMVAKLIFPPSNVASNPLL